MYRFLKYLTVFAAVVLLLFAIILFTASYLFDKKIESAISKFNSMQKHLLLSYKPKLTSVLTKKAELYVKVLNSPLGELNLVLDTRLDFGFEKISAMVAKENFKGDFDDILSKMNLPLIEFSGEFNIYPWALKADGIFKTKGFEYLLPDGICSIGENRLEISSHTLKNFDVSANISGFKCRGSEIYNGTESYLAELRDLRLNIKPVLDFGHKKIDLNSFTVELDKFSFDASTLYLIGFSPMDNVRDRSIRDHVEIDSVKVTTSLDKLRHDFYAVENSGTFNLSYAFPYVKENQKVLLTKLSDVTWNTKITSLNLLNLINTLKDGSVEIEDYLKGISSPLKLDLDSLTFKYNGDKGSVSGRATVSIDRKTKTPTAVDAEFRLAADNSLVENNMSKQYEEGFAALIQSGALKKTESGFETVFKTDGTNFTFNGVSVNPPKELDSDDLDENF
ncbi:MAG: hypothetical protein ACI4NE_01480 [Succinivibrio sp.]